MTPGTAAGRPAHERAHRVLAWVTIMRGCLALSLGVSLLLQREGTSETLATFMGLYWLIGGILTLAFRSEARAVGARRLPLAAGLFGVVAGSAVLVRGVVLQVAPTASETFLLVGILILLTGLTNMASGIRTGTGLTRERSQESLVLGFLEAVLGTGLIIARDAPGPLLILATTGWALTAGVILLVQGFRMRRRLMATSATSTNPSGA